MATTVQVEKHNQRFYDVTLELGVESSTNVGAALAANYEPTVVTRRVTLLLTPEESQASDPVRHGKIEAAKRAKRLAERDAGMRLGIIDWEATFKRESLVEVLVERDDDTGRIVNREIVR